jgi:hypothetical protein
MRHILTIFLITISLVACSMPPTASAQGTSKTATVSVVTRTAPAATLTQMTANPMDEEAEIRDLVEGFGKRLQDVPLQAPDAAKEIQKQYSGFVSPALLEMWMNDVSKAPGRIVSSPWPDRIEITTLIKEGSDRYVITGFVIEVTSVEMVNGGAAARIPARIVVQKGQGGWLITEYAEER